MLLIFSVFSHILKGKIFLCKSTFLMYFFAIIIWIEFNLELGRFIYEIYFSRFVAAFIDFPKPLIGVVNGPAVGVSVTTLGLYDAVYCTDKVIKFLTLIL